MLKHLLLFFKKPFKHSTVYCVSVGVVKDLSHGFVLSIIFCYYGVIHSITHLVLELNRIKLNWEWGEELTLLYELNVNVLWLENTPRENLPLCFCVFCQFCWYHEQFLHCSSGSFSKDSTNFILFLLIFDHCWFRISKNIKKVIVSGGHGFDLASPSVHAVIPFVHIIHKVFCLPRGWLFFCFVFFWTWLFDFAPSEAKGSNGLTDEWVMIQSVGDWL